MARIVSSANTSMARYVMCSNALPDPGSSVTAAEELRLRRLIVDLVA